MKSHLNDSVLKVCSTCKIKGVAPLIGRVSNCGFTTDVSNRRFIAFDTAFEPSIQVPD